MPGIEFRWGTIRSRELETGLGDWKKIDEILIWCENKLPDSRIVSELFQKFSQMSYKCLPQMSQICVLEITMGVRGVPGSPRGG